MEKSSAHDAPQSDREFLTFEQAQAMLPDGEYIHTFANPGGLLVRADWDREEVLDLLRKTQPELSGPMATGMGHGIVVSRDGRPLFIQTKREVAK
jgi:hypothetical protein